MLVIEKNTIKNNARKGLTKKEAKINKNQGFFHVLAEITPLFFL